MAETRKAVALISGGLDSMLAARVVMDEGVHVEGMNFFTGFCVEGHTHAIRNQDQAQAASATTRCGWPNSSASRYTSSTSPTEYKDIVLNPKHGYGAHLNPCLDCKMFMVDQALDVGISGREGSTSSSPAKSSASGRISAQDTMPLIARESRRAGSLACGRCAALNLPPTLPEREGWVDREQLFGFHGRNRKPQIELAERFGFTEWAQPAGGCCFFTDRSYSAKLADLWRARGRTDYSSTTSCC